MVERKVDAPLVFPGIVGKQVGVRDVGRDDKARRPALRRIARHNERRIAAGNFWVFKDIRGFAELVQAAAQRARAAGRVAVRAAVAEDQDVIRLAQQRGGFGHTYIHSSSSPPILPARSRSWMTLEMCAPLAMDESRWNTSSGA